MKALYRITHSLRSFARETSGSALPIVGIGIFTLLGATGIAIDMGRVQIVQSRMTSALDAAGLAAGATANSQDVSATAANYFNVNFPNNYMGSTLTSLSASLNGTGSVVLLDASAEVPTTFMRIFGTNSVEVTAHTEVTRSNSGMELVLVIDNTGSMSNSAGGGISKLQAAKNASASLLNIVYGATVDTADNLWVGLVPFSQAVNVGNNHLQWTRPDTFNWGPDDWDGCVDARENNDLDVTDTVPDTNIVQTLFPRYYWPCDSNNKWYGTNSSRDNCSTGSGMQYKTPISSASRGPNYYCPTPITPLVAEKSTVIAGVNAMAARGNTNINLGMAWAYRLLSPNWRNQWGGQMNANDLPLDYHTPLMNKIVVLLSDGDNTIDNGSRGGYWYLSNGKLGTTNQSTAVTTINNRTLQVCNSMKANGVIIYTIGLGTSISTAGQNLLRDCATNTQYYFASPTTSQLQSIFNQIGDSLANLRISK